MGTLYWLGTAPAVAEVDTFTPANVEIGDIFTLTATAENGSTTVAINFTATAATVANVTAGLVTAWNASTNVLCTVVTAADNTTNLTLTADSAGVPFHVASTTTNGGAADTQTLTRAATTASSGPNDWTVAANWSTGAIPINNDNVYFENNAVDVLYGLYSHAAVTLTSLNISQTYTGKIGTLAAYMQVQTAALDIGYYHGAGSPIGSGRIRLNIGALACAVTVHDSCATPTDTNYAPIRLLCNQANTNIEVLKGIVSIADDVPGETATFGTLYVHYVSVVATDAKVACGGGCTTELVKQTGGSLVYGGASAAVYCDGGTMLLRGSDALTLISVDGGTLTRIGTGTVATVNIYSGTLRYSGSGAITTVNCYGGTIDFTRTKTAKTVTNFLYGYPRTATVMLGPVVTLTNGIVNDGNFTEQVATTAI